MGYLGVKTALQAKRGDKVPPRIDTGARFLAAADLGKPDVQELIHPDLKRWLGE
jgi:ABC-type sugar transport system substrate-binding protein